MKTFILLGCFLAVVGLSHCSSTLLGKKLGLLTGKIFGGEKAFYKKIPLIGLIGGSTTTPAPTTHAPTYPPTRPTVKCDVIWEEKVTPLCKTVHEKICKTDTKDHCHKIWEDKCWDEPVEHCTPKEECNHVLENVCKTEYTVTCDDEDPHYDHKRSVVDEDEETVGLRQRRSSSLLHPLAAKLGKKAGLAVGKVGIPVGKVGIPIGLKKGAKKTGEEATTTPAPTPKPNPHPKEELCHHHPHTTCWDEPVEKCETVQECVKDVKNLCKKVPKEVCEPVSVENCWDEPSEKCEYMNVKVARKHCRDPHPKKPEW